ncbi:MAG TPA: very short patch repair endonuclease [Paludibacter sp.]|nr:very short patch repair endonuclease [Paludibacter sp.]
MDIWDKQKRSEVMSKIRSKNTKPEMLLRKALHARGFRFRVHYKKLPGRPDIVLPKYRTAIFVQGCFWHGHEGCRSSHIPKTNSGFWSEKINTNKNRDATNLSRLNSLGWNVLEVWECEIRKKDKFEAVIGQITASLENQLKKACKVRIYDSVDNEISLVAEETIHYE